MFINTQSSTSKEYYEKMLKVAGSLSNLFSESTEPYLGYRLVENLFCRSFSAENLSRSDTSIDASKEDIGIGIKTFIYRNGKSFEKVAEFNREAEHFKGLDAEKKIKVIAGLRNERLDFAKRTYNLSDMLYHCVARDVGKIVIYETPMHFIDIETIVNVKENGNTISFSDRNNNYRFNLSKSTLFKQFLAENPSMDFGVKIITDPFDTLDKFYAQSANQLVFAPAEQFPHVFLPLYSVKNNIKYVPEKSGLNQWNAAGRSRNFNEVYIPIPAWVHKDYSGFFPKRDVKFSLQLPNKTIINAKVCQDNNKALMSDPNATLGEWILRHVLNLKNDELLTYSKLESLGVDSVVIYKKEEGNYKIDFAKNGSYEQFMQGTESPDLYEEE